MPIFEYRGHDKSGKSVRGTVDADNLRAARTKLKRDGVFVTEMRDKTKAQAKNRKKTNTGKTVGVEDLSTMTRQLASMLKAQVPLVEALAATSEQVENPVLKESIADIKNMVNEGSSLNKGLAKYPKIFTKIYVTMCEAGEMSGTLDTILIRLAEFTEAAAELTAKIRSAMMYPLIMLCFTTLMLGVLMVFVIPQMASIFEGSDKPLPWYTQITIGVSEFMVSYWLVILFAIVAVIFLFRNWKNSEAGSAQWDRLVLRMPVVGRLARMIAVSRFTRTLSTLLAGGVPMLQAMDIVKNVVGNSVLEEAIEQARINIKEGESIAGPLKRSGQFPPIVTHMIAIGEKTGEIENMLAQVSDSYDFQVKNAVQGLTSIMEPVMIVVMGFVIGVIVFSIMLPMFDMANIGG